MHRIIGEATAQTQPPSMEDVLPLIGNITNKLSLDETKGNPVDKFPWIPFGEAILNQFEDNDAPKIAVLQNNLALRFKDFGNYTKAKALLEKAIHSDEQNFGEQHPTTAISYSNLASVYIHLNEIKKAVNLWEKAYTIFYNTFGAEYPNTKVVQEWLDKYKPKS